VLQERERKYSRKAQDGQRPNGELAKGLKEGTRIKASWYGYNQGKNQGKMSNFQMYFAKSLKASQDRDCCQIALFSRRDNGQR